MNQVMENVVQAGNVKPKKEMSESAKKKLYDKTKMLMDSTCCIKQYELYLYIYKVIIRRLRKLNGYLDSGELLEEYKERLKKVKEDGQEEIYQKALHLKEHVQHAEDIQWVRKEIARIPGYKDVDEIGTWCDNLMKKMEKQEQVYSTIRIILFLVIVVVAIAAAKVFLF